MAGGCRVQFLCGHSASASGAGYEVGGGLDDMDACPVHGGGGEQMRAQVFVGLMPQQ